MALEWLGTVDTPLPDVALGVTIRVTDRENDQLHVAVLHRADGEPATQLSLNWHAWLVNEAIPPGSRIVRAEIPEERAEAAAALCRRVFRRHGHHGLPYGILYEGGRINPDGLVELLGSTHGLTCATFVLLVFEHAGYPLVQVDTWPAREGDATWHTRIVETLEGTRQSRGEPSEEHIENVRGELGCARFRPGEVTAACPRCHDGPSPFQEIEPLGVEVRQALLEAA